MRVPILTSALTALFILFSTQGNLYSSHWPTCHLLADDRGEIDHAVTSKLPELADYHGVHLYRDFHLIWKKECGAGFFCDLPIRIKTIAKIENEGFREILKMKNIQKILAWDSLPHPNGHKVKLILFVDEVRNSTISLILSDKTDVIEIEGGIWRDTEDRTGFPANLC